MISDFWTSVHTYSFIRCAALCSMYGILNMLLIYKYLQLKTNLKNCNVRNPISSSLGRISDAEISQSLFLLCRLKIEDLYSKSCFLFVFLGTWAIIVFPAWCQGCFRTCTNWNGCKHFNSIFLIDSGMEVGCYCIM